MPPKFFTAVTQTNNEVNWQQAGHSWQVGEIFRKGGVIFHGKCSKGCRRRNYLERNVNRILSGEFFFWGGGFFTCEMFREISGEIVQCVGVRIPMHLRVAVTIRVIVVNTHTHRQNTESFWASISSTSCSADFRKNRTSREESLLQSFFVWKLSAAKL